MIFELLKSVAGIPTEYALPEEVIILSNEKQIAKIKNKITCKSKAYNLKYNI